MSIAKRKSCVMITISMLTNIVNEYGGFRLTMNFNNADESIIPESHLPASGTQHELPIRHHHHLTITLQFSSETLEVNLSLN